MQERARRTHEAVLDAAAQEFAAKGYTNTSISHVVARTGLTKGALYGHFASKEELAAALVLHLDQSWKTIEKQIGDMSGSPASILKQVTCELVARLDRDIRVDAALRLVLEGVLLAQGPSSFVADVERAVEQLVVKAQQAGQIDLSHPSKVVAQVLVTLIFGSHYLGSICEDIALIARVRAAWDVLLPALGVTAKG